MYIRVAGILDSTLVNGEGLRTAIFGSGCKHGCFGCHNQLFQDFHEGTDFPIENIVERIEKNSIQKKVTFSGGDPFFQAKSFACLAKELRKKEYNIWCYTGYTIEQILSSGNKDFLELLNNIDVLVDGKFMKELTENAPKYAGSSNQRIINIEEYLKKENIVLDNIIKNLKK